MNGKIGGRSAEHQRSIILNAEVWHQTIHRRYHEGIPQKMIQSIRISREGPSPFRTVIQFLLLTICFWTNNSFAQQANAVNPTSTDGKYQLAFYLPNWKTLHFNEPEKATQHLEAVQKLGCAVQKRDHAGHIDVVFRCNEWKAMVLDDADKAAGWQTWLKGYGFDTSLTTTDPIFKTGAETVDFRLSKWKRIHGNGSASEAEMIANLKKMGVEVVIEDHGNHNDISFRAPTWRKIHVADHTQAEQWMEWLKQVGFETRHQH